MAKKAPGKTGKFPRQKNEGKSEVIEAVRKLFRSHLMKDGGVLRNDGEKTTNKLTAQQPRALCRASHDPSVLPRSAWRHETCQLRRSRTHELQRDLVTSQEPGPC